MSIATKSKKEILEGVHFPRSGEVCILGECRYFNNSPDKGFGFLHTYDGKTQVFLHKARASKIYCDGSDHPVIGYNHYGRVPKPGDKLWCFAEKGAKGLRANVWGFVDELEGALVDIETRPMYRMHERRGFINKGKLYREGQATYRVLWEGKNLDELRRLCPNRVFCNYAVHDSEHSAIWFEKLVGDEWVACKDPR